MSRGHGNIQQFILDGLSQLPDPGTGALPVPWLSYLYSEWRHVENTPHLRFSMRRAIRRLAEEDRVGMYEYLLPSVPGSHSSDRWTLCVFRPDTVLSEDTYEFALSLMSGLFEMQAQANRERLTALAEQAYKEATEEGDREKLQLAKDLAQVARPSQK